MKRFFIAVLALFYLITSGGATLRIHYCMGEFVEWSLLDKKDEHCVNCGMERRTKESKDCCKDENKKIEVDKHQRTVDDNSTLTNISFLLIPIPTRDINPVRLFSIIRQNILTTSPPGSKSVAIYLWHCDFRI